MREAVGLVIFLLAVYGLANAFTLKIGRHLFGEARCAKKDCAAEGHPRETRKSLGRIPCVGDLVYCVACLSFLIGTACSLWILSPSAFLVAVRWKAALLDGFMACGASWILFAHTEDHLRGLDV